MTLPNPYTSRTEAGAPHPIILTRARPDSSSGGARGGSSSIRDSLVIYAAFVGTAPSWHRTIRIFADCWVQARPVLARPGRCGS